MGAGSMASANVGCAASLRRRMRVVLLAALGCLCSCHKATERQASVALPPGTILDDRTFHSDALDADATYRVIRPAVLPVGQPAHVLYLLHGYGNGYQDWSTQTPIAQLAARGYVLVMPEGHFSYYINSATKVHDRYEDFLTHDLIADAERGLQVPARSDRTIVGISMGGYAAIVLALKHPDLYGFAGALSPAIDVTQRPFELRRISQSLRLRGIFGPEGSATRSGYDPFLLAKAADPGVTPFLFLSVGNQESLREPVERFDALLRDEHIRHEFRLGDGGHDWQQWNRSLPALLESLEAKH